MTRIGPQRRRSLHGPQKHRAVGSCLPNLLTTDPLQTSLVHEIGSEPAHQLDETGKAGGNEARVVDLHRVLAGEP